MMRNRLQWGIAIGLAGLISSCASAPTQTDVAAATQGMARRDDLEIVDCLLPGQVRQLGNTTYLTQRRPTNTTAADCRIRGGEYVAYDRADLKSALAVWLAAAQAGDPEAQTNVAEIYERGLGVAPDYQAALMWYQKAADQNYARALFNLGSLYEQGLGVEQDKLKALNLYRQAWGLPADSVIYQSAAQAQEQSLRTELQQQLDEKNTQLKLLQGQLESLKKKLAAPATAAAASTADPEAKAQIEALQKWIAQLESERKSSNARLASLPQLREPGAPTATVPIDSKALVRSVAGLNFGRYFALVIGNQHYQAIASLQTPLNDAARAARVLREKYGFTVQVLEDSNDVGMLKALNDLNDVLKPDDNLLIYYAGHGARLKNEFAESGYWLPVNSDAPPKDTFWVANEQITAHLARLPARRILVVADSCYAGLLSTEPSYIFAGGTSNYTKEYIASKLPKRSRLLISSGGDEPVLDSGGGGNSVFARAFVAELENNTGILPAPELFSRLVRQVQAGATQNKFVQKPEFKAIKGAGHEVGDFFFIPTDLKL
jgi:uncharacterized protein